MLEINAKLVEESDLTAAIAALEAQISAIDARVTALEGDSPPDPDPDPGEYDGVTHFDAVGTDPNLHAAWRLRDQETINLYTKGALAPGEDNAHITADPEMLAAKVDFPAGVANIGTASQLEIPFPVVDRTTGDSELCFQWEARFDDSYLNLPASGLLTQKAFSLRKTGDKRTNFRLRLSSTDGTAVALPEVTEGYVTETYPGARVDPVAVFVDIENGTGVDGKSDYYDWQPGGDTAARNNHTYSASDHLATEWPDVRPFLILSNRWIRFTFSITWDQGGKERVRLWLSDEDTPPALVVCDPQNPSLGFLADKSSAAPDDKSGADRFLFEFGSSQTGTTNDAFRAWFRNLVVFRNATVPLLSG